MQKLSYLAHDEDQNNNLLCRALWSAVEGSRCSLHAITKSVVEGYYPTAGETLTDSIQKLEIYGTDNIAYSNKHGRSSYPTLEMKQQSYG